MVSTVDQIFTQTGDSLIDPLIQSDLERIQSGFDGEATNMWRRFTLLDQTVGTACSRLPAPSDWSTWCATEQGIGDVYQPRTLDEWVSTVVPLLVGDAEELALSYEALVGNAEYPNGSYQIQLDIDAPQEVIVAFDHLYSRYLEFCISPFSPDVNTGRD